LQHPERVDIVGIVTPKDVPAALRSVDAVIVPSLHEGLPNVAVEASACARPVIGSSIEPMREVVVHGETGTLVPPGDAVALRDALVAAARDRESLRLLGSAARVKMEREFDHGQYATKMLAIYRSVARMEVR
jgi:glycosyltransferase involved in cell wall biosynthesis